MDMNSVIKPFLDEHATRFELNPDDSQKFEHLVNYIALREYSSKTFDPAEASLGKGEVGLDGIGIFVNGILVSDSHGIESFFVDENGNKHVDISVSIIFTQAKTSEKFELNELSHFCTSVLDFIGDGKINETNERYIEFQKYINIF